VTTRRIGQDQYASGLAQGLLGLLIAVTAASGVTAADLDGNGIIDGADQSVLLASWGDCPAPCPSDLNGDGVVDGVDFAILLDAASAEGDGESSDTVESEGLYEGGDSSDTLGGGVILGPEPPVLTVKDEDAAIAIHMVPLPAPVWMGLAGLAAAAVLRRRLASR
jgi:hypothetical protein